MIEPLFVIFMALSEKSVIAILKIKLFELFFFGLGIRFKICLLGSFLLKDSKLSLNVLRLLFRKFKSREPFFISDTFLL